MTSKKRFYYRVSMQRIYICVCLGDVPVFVYLYIIYTYIYIQAYPSLFY